MSRRALALRHVPFEDLGILAPILEGHGYEIVTHDVPATGVDADAIVAADLLVILGGPIGVGEHDLDRYPFLTAEAEAVAARVGARRPTLGICLGAQLMARALGAEVAPTGGVEIGYAPLQLTEQGELSPLAHLRGVPVLHWHGDAFETPDAAVRLAATPGYPNQAFALGATLLGLQFHLEADHRRIESWLVGHAHELAAHGIEPARIRTAASLSGPELAVAARAVFSEWLGGLNRVGATPG